MKNWFIALLGIVGWLFLATETRADLEWSQALKSGPALRSYLEERSVQAYVSIDGDHVYWATSNWVQTNAANATALRKIVKSIHLRANFDPQYPTFWTRIQYSDVDGNCTVYGAENVTAEKVNGVWVIPRTVNLRVPDYMVPLPIPKGSVVNNAGVRIYDANGNIVGYRNCPVSTAQSGQQYLQYPGWVTGDQLALDGQTAELQMTESDGAGGSFTIVIDPSTGGEKIQAVVEGSLDPAIVGREYLATNQNILVTIPSQNSVGINPLYQLPISQTVTVTVRAKTSEGEVAPSFQYRRLKDDNGPGDTEWQPSPTGPFTFEPGTYDIWFDGWPQFHEDANHQMWDYYYGGGGGGKGG